MQNGSNVQTESNESCSYSIDAASVMCVPLCTAEGILIGVVEFYRNYSDSFYTQDSVDLVEVCSNWLLIITVKNLSFAKICPSKSKEGGYTNILIPALRLHNSFVVLCNAGGLVITTDFGYYKR